jgi:GTP-binding protein HflX
LRKITQEKSKRRNNNTPVIALVGYTNVGKSAFMNYLMKKEEVKSKDLLFQTLSTTSRQ